MTDWTPTDDAHVALGAQLLELEAELDDARQLRLAGELLMAGAFVYLGVDSLRAGRRQAAAIEFAFAAAIAGLGLYSFTTRRPRPPQRQET